MSEPTYPCFVVYDGDASYSYHSDKADALREARELVDGYRDQCDPCWPEETELVAIFYLTEATDDPEYIREQLLVARSVEVVLDEEPEDGADYACDFVIEEGRHGISE